MGIKTGAATARVLSEMYRERNLGEESRPIVSSRVPPAERKEDEAGPKVSDEHVQRGGSETRYG